MSYTVRTEYCCSVNTEKEYTSFRWNLPDFGLLNEYYTSVLSSEFMLTNSQTKCHLEFTLCKDEPKVEAPNTILATNSSSLSGSPSFPFGIACVSKNPVPIIQPEDHAYACVNFKCDTLISNMKVIVSIIDASGAKLKSVGQVKRFDNLKMNFKLIEASTLLNPFTAAIYMHNDTLTILCEIINIKKQESVLTDTKKLVDHFSNDVQENLQVFFKSKNFCDVTFAIGNTEFHGHKVILAANSPVFEAMFNTEMSEQIQKTVKIEDIDVVTFEAFLNYIYTGSVGKMDEIVEDLLVAADKYQVLTLRNLCETHIANNLCKENAIKYLLVAHLHNFETLKTKALLFIRACQQDIVDSGEFKKLCSYPDLVTEIFRKPS